MGASISLRRTLFCCSALWWAGTLHAQEVTGGVDVNVEAEAVSNPYLDDSDPSIVGAGTVEVRPWLHYEDGTDIYDLDTFARGRAFTGRYDFEDSLGATFNAVSRRSARTTLTGCASVFTTSARSILSTLARQPGVTDPIVPVVPAGTEPPLGTVTPLPGDDITLLGLQGRTTTYNLAAGVRRVLDARSSLQLDIGYQKLTVGGAQGTDYDSAFATVSYDRQVSQRTRLGFSGSVRKTVYQQGYPNAVTVQGALTGQHQFDTHWTLQGSVGVASTHSPALGIYPSRDTVGLTGDLSLCNRWPRSNLCVTVSRYQQPSALGETRSTTSASFTYSERVSERDRVDISGGYSRSTAPSDTASPYPQVETASIRAALTRSLSPRTEGYLFASTARTYGSYSSNEPSIELGIGVRFKIGQRR